MPVYNLTIDDVSPLIIYDGVWKVSSRTDDVQFYYGNTYHTTQGANASATLTFNGTGIYIYGSKRYNRGLYSVTIDGGSPFTDNGMGKDIYQALLFSRSDLPYGLHRVTHTNVGTPDYIDLDYIIITTGDGQSETISQNITFDDSVFRYDDGWASVTGAGYFNSTLHQTKISNAVAQVPFNGNAIELYGSVSAENGLFSVSLDGSKATILNGTHTEPILDTLLYQIDGLPDGDHILTVENLSDTWTNLDRAIVSSYSTPNSTFASSSQETPATTSTATPPESTVPSSSYLGTVIGLTVSLTILLLISVFGLVWFLRRRRKELNRTAKHSGFANGPMIEQIQSADDRVAHDSNNLPPSYDMSSTGPSSGQGSQTTQLYPNRKVDQKRAQRYVLGVPGR